MNKSTLSRNIEGHFWRAKRAFHIFSLKMPSYTTPQNALIHDALFEKVILKKSIFSPIIGGHKTLSGQKGIYHKVEFCRTVTVTVAVTETFTGSLTFPVKVTVTRDAIKKR